MNSSNGGSLLEFKKASSYLSEAVSAKSLDKKIPSAGDKKAREIIDDFIEYLKTSDKYNFFFHDYTIIVGHDALKTEHHVFSP